MWYVSFHCSYNTCAISWLRYTYNLSPSLFLSSPSPLLPSPIHSHLPQLLLPFLHSSLNSPHSYPLPFLVPSLHSSILKLSPPSPSRIRPPLCELQLELSTLVGYDLTTDDGYNATMEEFDRLIGMKYLMAMHINDSKGACHRVMRLVIFPEFCTIFVIWPTIIAVIQHCPVIVLA